MLQQMFEMIASHFRAEMQITDQQQHQSLFT